MAKPVIWTVDDDPDVLRAVERDLRRHYGDRYKVISADSGDSALEATKQLKRRNEPVALFLVDQRMPRMSGVEFLEKATGSLRSFNCFVASRRSEEHTSELQSPYDLVCRLLLEKKKKKKKKKHSNKANQYMMVIVV